MTLKYTTDKIMFLNIYISIHQTLLQKTLGYGNEQETNDKHNALIKAAKKLQDIYAAEWDKPDYDWNHVYPEHYYKHVGEEYLKMQAKLL